MIRAITYSWIYSTHPSFKYSWLQCTVNVFSWVHLYLNYLKVMFDQLSWLSADNKMLVRSGKMNKIPTGSSTKCHLKHLDGQVWAIKQCRLWSDWSRTSSLIRIYTVCHFRLHLLGMLLHCSNFRIIIAFFSDVQIFWIFIISSFLILILLKIVVLC